MSDDLSRLALRLAGQAVQEQVRTLQRYGDLVNRIATGELDERAIRDEAVRFAREETARYLQEVASLGLRHQSALLELERARNDRFFAALEQRLDDGPEAVRVPQRVQLSFRGTPGEEVGAAFAIENKRGTVADISFVVSEFVGPSDDPPFRPPLVIDPPSFTLSAGEEQAVHLRLPLTAELFKPGTEYRSIVAVRGYEELELVLVVQVDEG
jgi:hypothetical protein